MDYNLELLPRESQPRGAEARPTLVSMYVASKLLILETVMGINRYMNIWDLFQNCLVNCQLIY